MTLFDNLESIIKKKTDIDGVSVNYLNSIISKLKDIMFANTVEIYTCTSVKTLNGKKVGLRVILIKCKGRDINTLIRYNYPSDKNRSETIVLINALQIARFINTKIKLDTVIYNNSEYALDFVTEQKYIKNTNKDVNYYLQKTGIREIDFTTIKKIYRKDNFNKLQCKEFCQIKYLKY